MGSGTHENNTILCYNIVMNEDAKQNPIDTRKNHKKQATWQIWVPLIVAVLVAIFLAVMIIIFTARDINGEFNTKWAGISIIYLSIPAIVLALLLLAFLGLLIYLIYRLYKIIPDYSQKVLEILTKIRFGVDQASEKISKPVIFIKSKWSGLTKPFKKNSETA